MGPSVIHSGVLQSRHGTQPKLHTRPEAARQNDALLFAVEVAEVVAAHRVAELPERFRLDLADSLAGDGELLADLLERVVDAAADAEPHPKDALLPRRQRRERARRLLAQVRV